MKTHKNLNPNHQRYTTTLVRQLDHWVQTLPAELDEKMTKTKEWHSMIASFEYVQSFHQKKSLDKTTARQFMDIKNAMHEVRMEVDRTYMEKYSSVVEEREAIIQQALGSKHLRYARRIHFLQELHRAWAQLPTLMHIHERALWQRFKAAVKEAQHYETKTRKFEVADAEVAYHVKKHLLAEAKLVQQELPKSLASSRLHEIEKRWRDLPKVHADLDKRLRAKLRDIQRAVEERSE